MNDGDLNDLLATLYGDGNKLSLPNPRGHDMAPLYSFAEPEQRDPLDGIGDMMDSTLSHGPLSFGFSYDGPNNEGMDQNWDAYAGLTLKF